MGFLSSHIKITPFPSLLRLKTHFQVSQHREIPHSATRWGWMYWNNFSIVLCWETWKWVVRAIFITEKLENSMVLLCKSVVNSWSWVTIAHAYCMCGHLIVYKRTHPRKITLNFLPLWITLGWCRIHSNLAYAAIAIWARLYLLSQLPDTSETML